MSDETRAPPKTGRPRFLKDAYQVRAYLDQATVDRARQIGAGNLSAGLRIAVARAWSQYARGEGSDGTT